MARKFSIQYVDRLLDGNTYHDLVEISSAIGCSSQFVSHAPDYNLPTFAFLFVETLLWFAQAIRSGVWTYYEATPLPRQQAMVDALHAHAPDEFAELYARGIADWQDEQKIKAVDEWIKANDDAANEWLRRIARENRDKLLSMT